MRVKNAIIVESVSKKYKLYKNMKDRLFDLFSPKDLGESFYALKDVDFIAERGEVVGFIGINGSGKSTLSNIIAGIVPETSGKITVNGQASLIAVSAGLKNDLTGRDNIELKLLMLGLDSNEIKSLEEDIIEFSELGQFIDQPVKSYSSGMKSRLGFSISVNVDPDILIIDEALSVGDKAFAEKSLSKMNEFKDKGKTMIFVSHSLGQMKSFCDKILWLEYGKVKAYGDVEEIMPQYEEFLNIWKLLTKEERDTYRDEAIAGTLNYQNYLKKIHNEKRSIYKEILTSKLAKIRSGNSYIYESPLDEKPIKSSKEYIGSSYYVKKEGRLNDNRYFLLSEKPSSVEGIIGWMKLEDLHLHNLVFIDEDPKKFIIKGNGDALNRQWGDTKNIVYDDLSSFKGQIFNVIRTDKVGNNNWYYGKIQEELVWLHASRLETI